MHHWQWLPAFLFQDVLFLWLLYQFQKMKNKLVFFIVFMVTMPLAVLNAACLWINRHPVPWSMAPYAFMHWDSYKKLVHTKIKEIPILYVGLASAAILAIAARSISNHINRRNRDNYKLPESVRLEKQQGLALDTKLRGVLRKKRALLFFIYTLYANLLCPRKYKTICRSLLPSIVLEVHQGYREMKRFNTIAGLAHNESQTLANDVITVQDPVNIVVVFLESFRDDMSPFNSSSPFALKHLDAKWIPKEGGANPITPFYEHLIQQNITAHVPKVKTASTFTSKSLFSAFCSTYASPIPGTEPETKSKLVNQCLPRILKAAGYEVNFFQSVTGDFDMKRQMMANIGFPQYYTLEQYEEEYSEEVRKKYWKCPRTHYFKCYEDNAMIPVMAKWVDQQREKEKPFLLGYETFMTHDPFTLPGSSTSLPHFTKVKKANNYLNAVAYTDRFLKKLIQEFEERQLMDKTLFVLMGDHGIHERTLLGLSGIETEGLETQKNNVAVTFHTQNENLSRRLAMIKMTNSHVSVDVTPTILDLLGSQMEEQAVLHGRSMLKEHKNKRLTVTIGNPSLEMHLRDGPYFIHLPLHEASRAKLFDVSKDPGHQKPRSLQESEKDDIIRWGWKAFNFLGELRQNLVDAHTTGVPCEDCALTALVDVESLSA